MASPLAAGTKLGRYEIRSQLGAGGMGEVYLAQDTKLDRRVALKILPADVAADQARMRRFIQEAKAASALNHPNIITIHEIEQIESVNFISTEFIDGETLRQRVRKAPMNLGEVLDVAVQVASALSAAHTAGLVHRDIKPENIMVRRDGIVKVLDFGLAKITSNDSETVDTQAPTAVKTEPGIVMGTAIYMSPEQARGLAVDARTDVFSLGVVLYELITGRLPFEGSASSDVLASILNEKEPQPLARYSREVPAELERIVSKALRKNREERYQTIKDMLIDLQRLKEELEFERKLERSVAPHPKSGGTTVEQADAGTVTGSAARRTVREKTLMSARKLRQRSVVLVVAALLMIASSAGAYFYFTRTPSRAINSIAVLPFVNAGSNPDTEYLSDGISESLINSLSQLPDVKVIARSSSFRYKGKDVDPQEVANSLGVEAILTGRVLQHGDNLLISVELMNARDKTQVWGEQYNRNAADVIQVQSEISREIAEKLRLRLSPSAQQQLSRRETANPQAYNLLLKGRFYRSKGGDENQKKALEYFQQAISLDRTYAAAYAELSAVYNYLVGNGVLDPKEFTPKAETAVRTALELDESLAEAHLALANIKLNAWDWITAQREYQRAIELNPNLAEARRWYSVYLTVNSRHDQAIIQGKRSRELDPLSLAVSADAAFSYAFARRYDEAIEALRQTLELDQNNVQARYYLGYVYTSKGMYTEAIAEFQKAIKLEDSSSFQIYLGAAYAKSGDRGKGQEILKQLQTSKRYVSPGELPVLYAALGDREQAFASFEKAYAAHDLQLQYLGVDASFDSLRSDPRFQDLLRRVGLRK